MPERHSTAFVFFDILSPPPDIKPLIVELREKLARAVGPFGAITLLSTLYTTHLVLEFQGLAAEFFEGEPDTINDSMSRQLAENISHIALAAFAQHKRLDVKATTEEQRLNIQKLIATLIGLATIDMAAIMQAALENAMKEGCMVSPSSAVKQ